MLGRQRVNQNRSGRSVTALLLGGVGLALVFLVVVMVFGASRDQVGVVAAVAPGNTEIAPVKVLVANADIEAGTTLDTSLFRLEEKSTDFSVEGFITNSEQLKGTFAQSFIAAGHPLRSEFVSFKQPSSVVEVEIPDGYRAVSVLVDHVTSVEGWARPGAKVDVMVVNQVGGEQSIQSVVQNAKVLPGGGGGPGAITLLVTEEEASKIIFATNSGTLTLALRGDEDDAEGALNSTVKLSDIIAVEGPTREQGCPQGKAVIEGMEFCIVNGKLIPAGSLK